MAAGARITTGTRITDGGQDLCCRTTVCPRLHRPTSSSPHRNCRDLSFRTAHFRTTHCPSPDSSLPDNSLPGEPDNPGTAPEAPGDTVPGDPDNGGSQDAFADAVVELVNAERAKVGLSPLSVHEGVAEAANKRAQEIKGTFSHTRPDGSNFSTVLTQAGISYRSVGENIAYGQNSPEAVMQSWMNSSGHRANILNRDFTSIGVGHYQDASGTDYWTQLFIK